MWDGFQQPVQRRPDTRVLRLAVCVRTRHIERDIIQLCRDIVSTNRSTHNMSRSNWIMSRSNWIMSSSLCRVLTQTANHSVLWCDPTTKHDSQQYMSGQFLFYYKYEAIDYDKPSDSELPCRIVLNTIAIVIMKASLETALEQSISVTSASQWLTPDVSITPR